MKIDNFLELLEQRGLVSQSIVNQLRNKVDQDDQQITPESVLNLLVKKGLITQAQANQLLEETISETAPDSSDIFGAAPPSTRKIAQLPPEEVIPTIEPVHDSASSDIFGRDSPSTVSESLSRISGTLDPALADAIEKGKSEADSVEEPHGKKDRRWKKANKNEWDSSLLLIGGGGLIFLVLAGLIIGYLLTRENADAILAEAGEFYDGGSYTQAIKQYSRFVENHPNHPEFSAGKVRLGLAKLWKTSSGTSNYSEALDTAQIVLPEIEDEEEFKTAQRDLASLLPKIAQGLANQAERANEADAVESLVKQSNIALSLCNNTKYIPKTFRDEVLLSEVSETLDRVQREQEQNRALTKALADMQLAIDAKDTAQAYQVHDRLLDEHPGLINEEQLAAKVLEISAAESSVVRYIAEAQDAITEPRPSRVVAELALANRVGPTVDGQGGVVAVRVSGAVYGLSTSDGAVRWRRFVGFAPNLTPVQLPSGDVLAVDPRFNELLKLEADSGKLLWRHPFESDITSPVPLDTKILVAESAGKLHVLDAESGERKGFVQFAQKLSTPPGLDTQKRHIYQTGEHSSLYTLSTENFSCLGVYFLDHSKGSVTTPPVNVLNKVIVAVAKGLSTTKLEVLNTTDEGVVAQRATNQRLSGLVNTPLLTEGRRLVAVTSRGQVSVYDVGSGDDKSALTRIASRAAGSGSQMARFGALREGHVWVAGSSLNKLAILPTSDRLAVSPIDRDFTGDTFDHPLQSRGNLLVHVRHPANQAGVIVGATSRDAGNSLWETELAVPPAGPPAMDSAGMRIGSISSTGSAFLIDRDAMRNRVVNRAEKPTARGKLSPLIHSLDLGQGRLLASAPGSQRMLHFRPDQPRQALSTIRLPAAQSCPPVVWGDAFVVPTQVGQVHLFSCEDGQPWGTPFQPPSQPGVAYPWNAPAVYGSGNDAQLVISDGHKKVYLLNRILDPHPHLEATVTADITTSMLNTRFALVGDLALAGTEGSDLAVLQLPSLEAKPSVNLSAQITWGPFTVGENVVLATASEELLCLDEQASLRWRLPLAHGPPAGQPLLNGDALLLLCQEGGLSEHRLDDGEEMSYVPLPQPTVSGPVPFGKRLVVTSYDGTLLVVDYP